MDNIHGENGPVVYFSDISDEEDFCCITIEKEGGKKLTSKEVIECLQDIIQYYDRAAKSKQTITVILPSKPKDK